MACVDSLGCTECVDPIRGCVFGIQWNGVRKCVRGLTELGDRVLSVTLSGGKCEGAGDDSGDEVSRGEGPGFFSRVASSGLGTVLGVSVIVGSFVAYTNRGLIRRKLRWYWVLARRWWSRCCRGQPLDEMELGGVARRGTAPYGTMTSTSTASTVVGSESGSRPATRGRGRPRKGRGRGAQGSRREQCVVRDSTRLATVIALERQEEERTLRDQRKRNMTL